MDAIGCTKYFRILFHFLQQDMSDERILFTATDALVSKHSACKLKYFNDPYLLELFDQSRNRHMKKIPLINRGYYSRVMTFC